MDPALEILLPDGRLIKIFADGSITGAADGTCVVMNRVWPTMARLRGAQKYLAEALDNLSADILPEGALQSPPLPEKSKIDVPA